MHAGTAREWAPLPYGICCSPIWKRKDIVNMTHHKSSLLHNIIMQNKTTMQLLQWNVAIPRGLIISLSRGITLKVCASAFHTWRVHVLPGLLGLYSNCTSRILQMMTHIWCNYANKVTIKPSLLDVEINWDNRRQTWLAVTVCNLMLMD